nr:tropomyosin-2-like [Aegilops tauschii subsp. strangulata]
MGALSQLGEELVDVDARLETEGLRLADEWHQFKVAINLGRLQRERASAKAESSLAASREASARALEEAREADRRREAAKERARELQALNAILEQQVEARKAILASMRGVPSEEKEISKREEVLMLEASEGSLELERLEKRERQVAQAEDTVSVREAGIQEEVDRTVAKTRANLANRHYLKLKLLEAKAEGRTTTLRSRLDEAEQREKAAMVSLIFVQAYLASAHADLPSLQQQVDGAASLA